MPRGRRPQGNYKGKTKVLSTRITAELSAALRQSAAIKGHSVSQEIEHRLRRSFGEDLGIIERFGNRRNYAVLRLISSYMDALYKPGDLDASWLDDPYIFAQLERAVALMFDQLRPAGDARPPLYSTIGLSPDDYQATQVGAALLEAVKAADPGVLPITGLAALIRDDLGAVADRITAKPDDGEALAAWLRRLVPRRENESEDAYRSRALGEILAMRQKGEKL